MGTAVMTTGATTRGSGSGGFFRSAFGTLQKIGKALMLPVAVLPAAGILLGVGSAKFHWLPETISSLMANAGGAVFDNLALIFAIGVVLGLTANDGVAALAAVVGYFVMTQTLAVMAKFLGRDWWKSDDGTMIGHQRSFDPLSGILSIETSWEGPSGSGERSHRSSPTRRRSIPASSGASSSARSRQRSSTGSTGCSCLHTWDSSPASDRCPFSPRSRRSLSAWC